MLFLVYVAVDASRRLNAMPRSDRQLALVNNRVIPIQKEPAEAPKASGRGRVIPMPRANERKDTDEITFVP